MKRLSQEFSELQDKIYQAWRSVENLNKALDLGFRANCFQPAYDAFKQGAKLAHRLDRLEQENDELKAQVDLIKLFPTQDNF